MKTRFLVLFFALTAMVSVQAQFTISRTKTPTRTFQSEQTNPEQKARPIPGQYIVELKESVARPVIKSERKGRSREEAAKLNDGQRRKNLSLLREVFGKYRVSPRSVLHQYADVTVGFTAKLSNQQVEQMKKDPRIKGVFQDFTLILPPFKIGNIKINTQVKDCAVSKAGGPKDGSKKFTWIWILDTGIDLDHPDLNVQKNAPFAKSFIAGQSVDDLNGHGTHVAGIAAAKNNHFGVVGVSAGARVVPVKVLPNVGSGSWGGLLSGLNHVAMYDIPGDVVNMSLGGYGFNNCQNANPAIRDAIRNLGNAGTWVVMAAGNDRGDANRNLPGCINGNRVYTVGGITCTNSCYINSNWGSAVDWVAVGVNVNSTYKGKGYKKLTGTSMATPVVAGIIHARGGAPLSAGTVNCGGGTYKIAKR